jgi:hypothetical protein
LLTFQGPFTLVTDLALPRAGSQGYYLVPNPSSSPLFTAAGLPLYNSGTLALASLSLVYNNITVQVPCSTLQLYITALCQQEVDSNILINRWGILYRQFTGSMVRQSADAIDYHTCEKHNDTQHRKMTLSVVPAQRW